MADKNTADIGFEKQIWNAACVLMGNLDASEYKSVVLGLIFLKYISNRFDEKYKALLAEGMDLKRILMSIHLKVSSSFLLMQDGVKLRDRHIHQKLEQ
jgi:type I restriction-modification system DNA methylase subunit